MQRAQEEKNHGEHWERGSIEGGTTMEHREMMGCKQGIEMAEQAMCPPR